MYSKSVTFSLKCLHSNDSNSVNLLNQKPGKSSLVLHFIYMLAVSKTRYFFIWKMSCIYLFHFTLTVITLIKVFITLHLNYSLYPISWFPVLAPPLLKFLFKPHIYCPFQMPTLLNITNPNNSFCLALELYGTHSLSLLRLGLLQ